METFDLQFFATRVNVWLFDQVKNAGELKKALIHASQTNDRAEQCRLDWAFIDASMVSQPHSDTKEKKKKKTHLFLWCSSSFHYPQITSPQHLITAVSQALVTHSHGNLKTKTLHSEILWTLSPGSNVRIKPYSFCSLLLLLP
jgi:EKC/KEOPS complex subunit CGI121/TPRKB